MFSLRLIFDLFCFALLLFCFVVVLVFVFFFCFFYYYYFYLLGGKLGLFFLIIIIKGKAIYIGSRKCFSLFTKKLNYLCCIFNFLNSSETLKVSDRILYVIIAKRRANILRILCNYFQKAPPFSAASLTF